MSKQHWRYMNFKNWYPLEWRNALRSYAANTQTNQIASVYSRGNRANTSNWLGIVLQQNNGDLSPAFLQQASARLESIDCVGRRDYQNYAHHHPCHGDQLQPAPFPDAAENIWRLQYLNNLLAEARILTLLAVQQQANHHGAREWKVKNHLWRGNLDRKVISPKTSSRAAPPESDGAVAPSGSASRFWTVEDAGTSG